MWYPFVEDDGLGMPASTVERVFEPFFDMVASGRKRALGSPAAGPVHKRLRTGQLAIAAGHQARRGLVPPLIPEEIEPGAVVKHALGLQQPVGLDAPLADDLIGAVDILRRGSEAASRSRSEARSKWQARAEAPRRAGGPDRGGSRCVPRGGPRESRGPLGPSVKNERGACTRRSRRGRVLLARCRFL